jgi:hypothetical protein
MTCCETTASLRETSSEADEPVTDNRDKSEAQRCTHCKSQSRPVSRKTVLVMLKPELLEQAMTGRYSFCSARDCPVVYFEERDRHRFTIDDLRVTVGVKASADPIPLCYCFGFDESHVRDEISKTGTTTIPNRISALIRQGLCACESRNPGGACCLGEVNRAARRFTATERSTEGESNV